MGSPRDLDPVAIYDELAAPLRRASAALVALPGAKGWALSDFARTRADEQPDVSSDDAVAYRERFVREAAALFAGEPYGQSADVSLVYEAHVLKPMREVRSLIDERLPDATVSEKLAFHRQISQRREDFPGEGAIITAINLMVASTIPGSDMNY